MQEQDGMMLAQLALDLGEEYEDGQTVVVDEVEARRRSELARLRLEEPNPDPRSQRATLEGREWLEGYNELRQMGFGWRVAAYIAWAASPKIGRKPARLEDLAMEVLGLTSARAIYVWRRKNPAIDEAVGMLRSKPLHEHRADVYKALIEMATRSDYKSFNDRKLFLELVGDIRAEEKGPSVVVNVNQFRAMSTEELLRIAGRTHPPIPSLKGRIQDAREKTEAHPVALETSDSISLASTGSANEMEGNIIEGEVMP